MTRFISLLVACAIALLGAAPSDAVTGPRRVLPLSGSVLWTPLNLGSSLVAWWDASYIPGLTGGSSISAWTDRMSGIVASQATGANQPGWSATARNGKPGLTFNGSSTRMTFTPTGFSTGVSAFSLSIASFVSNGVTTQIEAFGYGPGVAGQSATIGSLSSGNSPPSTAYLDQFGTGINQGGSSVTWPNNDRFVVASIPSGATSTITLAVDGVATTGTSASRNMSLSGGGMIGAYVGATNFWSGTIQQLVATNAALSTCQRQKLEGWESWYDGKNGSNLPATHPYKSYAPTVGRAC
jgi:hypothetical protein